MTTQDHMARVTKLAQRALAWEAQDTEPVCSIEKPCWCPMCGAVTEIVRGHMVARGWDRAAVVRRITTEPPTECSYPYLASLRVDGAEVYRISRDLAEVLDADVLDDVEAALERNHR